jgi:hypothetical protein
LPRTTGTCDPRRRDREDAARPSNPPRIESGPNVTRLNWLPVMFGTL